MAIEKISYRGKALALIVYADEAKEGVHFFTPDDYALQLGKHAHPKGKTIKAHLHCPVQVERFASLQEVLYIEKGKVRITFFTQSGKKIKSKILAKGDVILLMEGGHGFEFLEKTKMIEIKQGPYLPESRKSLEAER